MIPDYFKKKVKNNPKLYSIWFYYITNLRPYQWTFRKQLLKIIDHYTDEKKLMINLGSGEFYLRHWRNLDYETDYYKFRRGLIDYYHNLKSPGPFPFRDNQVYLFYSSQTIEHIPQKYCQHIFDEIYRCLKPNGGVRLMMPDLDGGRIALQNNDLDYFAEDMKNVANRLQEYDGPIETKFLHLFATYFVHVERLKPQEIREKINSMGYEEYADYLTNKIPDDYQRDNMGHCCWWNYIKLERMLKKSGFETIYPSKPFQSRFPEMRKHKTIRHSFDTHWPNISVIAEAIKT